LVECQEELVARFWPVKTDEVLLEQGANDLHYGPADDIAIPSSPASLKSRLF